MTTFVLVHGAWLGGWCWELLAPELERRGHRTIAVDLPGADPHASFEDYAAVVCSAVAAEVDDAVLVGHSLGGHSVARAASRRQFRHVVYLCALVPEPGRSMLDQARDRDGMLNPAHLAGLGPADEAGRTSWVDEQVARELLHQDCDEAVAHAAFARMRPQASALYRVPCPLPELPRVPSTYVISTDDRMIGADWSRRAAERLGADVVEIPGGHCPYLARPRDLADVLATVSA